MEINMSKADGYAVVLDDKGSPYGYWFVGAWNTQESAEIALKGQKGNGRIVPLYFRPEATATRDDIIEECAKIADRGAVNSRAHGGMRGHVAAGASDAIAYGIRALKQSPMNSESSKA
jgi:hypothetical protein